jgi:hypothetical protein
MGTSRRSLAFKFSGTEGPPADYVATNEARTHSYDQCMNAILAGIKEVEELRAEEVRIREEERQLAEGKAARGSAGEGNISEQGIMEKEGAGKQEDKGKNVARTPKTKTKIETVVEGLYRLIAPSPPELMEESDSDDDEIPPAQANHAPNSSIDVSRPPPRKPPHGHRSPVHKTGASQPVLINGLRVSLYDQRPADANEGGLTRVRSEAEMAELYTRFKEKGEVLNDFHYHRPFAHLFNTISTCVPNEYLDSLLSSRPFHPRYRSTLDEALVASATDDKVYQFVYVYGLEMDDATARRFIKSTKEGPFLTEMAKERKGTSARAWVAGVELEIEMAKAEGRVVRIVSYTGWAAGGLDALNIQARPNDHLHGKPHSLFTHILALVRQDAYLVSNSLLRLSLVAKFDSLDQLSVSSKMAGEQVICVMIGSSTLEGGANVNGTGDGNPLIASLDYLRAQAPSLHLDQLPSPSSLRNMVLDWAESWRLRDPTVRMGTVDDFLRFWSAREMEKAAERKEVGKKSVAQLAGIERRARMREEEKQRTKKEREMYGGPSCERLEVVSRRLSFAPDSCICPICSKDCLYVTLLRSPPSLPLPSPLTVPACFVPFFNTLIHWLRSNTNAIRLHVAGCSDTHLADGYVNSLARSSNLDPFVCLDARCKAKGQLGKWKATVDAWPEAQLEEAAARPRAELEGLIVHVQAHFRAGSWEKACPVESCGFE